jgi:hypothetical protein
LTAADDKGGYLMEVRNMFTIRCARCGKIHYSASTLRRVVSYNGKKLVRVCSDDRQCWPSNNKSSGGNYENIKRRA